VKDAHPHRFHNTFSVALLIAGVPIDDMSISTQTPIVPYHRTSIRAIGSGEAAEARGGCSEGVVAVTK
jgi:hypothetical protein